EDILDGTDAYIDVHNNIKNLLPSRKSSSRSSRISSSSNNNWETPEAPSDLRHTLNHSEDYA
ncbi:hypothetical protein FCV25MIE_02562, partial [Fagus crenata]